MLTIAIAGAVLFALLLIVVWAGQRRMMYFPHPHVSSPSAEGLQNAETVTFSTDDGLRLNGWFLASTRPPPWFTVVVFNGNAGNRAFRIGLGDAFRATGCAVLLFDYRGFGDNPGTPTEAGLTADARAARTYLLSRADVDAARVVYFGESLGTAVATRLAAEHPPAGLILRSPFTSITAVGQIHYPILPVRWLLRDRFDAVSHVPQVRSPLLVIAGSRDRIVPMELSRRLYEAASPPKTLVVIEGADHNDSALNDGEEMFRAIVDFLSGLG